MWLVYCVFVYSCYLTILFILSLVLLSSYSIWHKKLQINTMLAYATNNSHKMQKTQKKSSTYRELKYYANPVNALRLCSFYMAQCFCSANTRIKKCNKIFKSTERHTWMNERDGWDPQCWGEVVRGNLESWCFGFTTPSTNANFVSTLRAQCHAYSLDSSTFGWTCIIWTICWDIAMRTAAMNFLVALFSAPAVSVVLVQFIDYHFRQRIKRNLPHIFRSPESC